MARPALFLDRDGVLNEPVWDVHTGSHESPLAPDDVVLVGDAAEAVRLANGAGVPVVIVSNQPAAAKQIITSDDITAVHARVLDLLAERGAVVLDSYLCRHHPDGTDPVLGRPCECRKPGPGLLLRAARDHDLDLAASWLVGDTDADAGAAVNASLAGAVVVTHPRTAHRRTEFISTAGTAQAPTTLLAVSRVLQGLARAIT